jgi:hypothetical protein
VTAQNRLSEQRLLLVCSGVLFVLCAWPLVLVTLPPYQDVPNFLASAVVMDRPDLYPDLVTNSFFKTNAAVFAWMHFVGALVGPVWAMRLFITLVLALNAYAFPRLVAEVAGARRAIVASLFLVPMVHNWFVSMGMLNFALGVPLALLTIVALQRQRLAPSYIRSGAVAFFAAATWYAHFVPLVLLLFLAAIEIVVVIRRSRSDGRELLVRVGPPLAFVVVLALVRRIADVGSGHHGAPVWLDLWEIPYNLWAEWAYGFTEISAASIVACGVLLVLGVRRFREPVPFFSPIALALLAVIYVASPHIIASWFYANTRVVPFLWAALLVRVPERLPRPLVGLLGAIALSFSAALGIDFVRLAREREAFDAGIAHVPERARLLPFVFDRKGASKNTRHLAQAWGSYVLAKHTAAPLVFARSRAYGVSYREPPPPELDHIVFEETIGPLIDEATWCAKSSIHDDCAPRYAAEWARLWEVIEPRFDHVLFWGATKDVFAHVPSGYARVFESGKLAIYARASRP